MLFLNKVVKSVKTLWIRNPTPTFSYVSDSNYGLKFYLLKSNFFVIVWLLVIKWAIFMIFNVQNVKKSLKTDM